MKITEISIKRPTVVVVVFTILTLLGYMSYKSLNYELLPKFSVPVVSVTTVYPGASPGEVENTVTKKIEDAVASMENIKKLSSRSMESLSSVTIELNSNANADLSLQEAQRKVNAILADLPDDVKAPSLNKFSLDDLPIITLAATANMDNNDLYDLLDNKITPSLSRINGVAQINLIGGQEREIRVDINAGKLAAYKLSLNQVKAALQQANLDFPTGKVKSAENQILIRLSGKFKDVQSIRDAIITTNAAGSPIRFRDIADVQESSKEVEKIARVDQQAAIALSIQKQSDANAVKVSEDVQKMVLQLQEEYAPLDLKIQIASDSSVFTLEAADAVIHDLVLAIILVAAVMLLFLHSIRNAIIVMISIPISLIATFIGIKLMGFSLNLMSLMGLSLVVGILVDDAIVVLENIQRHMEMGKNKVKAAFDGAKEIGFTVVAITLVIVVVFFPIAMSTGMVSDILRQFCMVVVIATLLSLLISFTVVPWLASRFGKLEHIQGKNIFGKLILWFERVLERFTNWISGILTWALGHKIITLVVVFALLVGSFMLVGKGYIGGEFMPKGDRGEFMVQLELNKDASLEVSNAATRKAEAYLQALPEVTSLITTVGQSSEDGFGAANGTAYKSEITVKLVPINERKDESDVYAAKVRLALENEVPGVKIKTIPVSILGTAERAPLELISIGADYDSVMAYAKTILSVVQSTAGTKEAKLSVEDGTPEINVEVDRDKMAALGLTLDQVGLTMQTAFSGNDDAKFRKGAYEYDIRIGFDDFDRKNMNDVGNLAFQNSRGEQVRLFQFAAITEQSGPSRLERRDKNSSVSVQAQMIGRTGGDINNEIKAKLDELPKPVGVSYIFGGDAENQGEAFGTLGAALMISLVLVYLIMVVLYDNYIYPLVVMFSIPLAIIGALLALALTNNSLNMFSILGIIMLIGLVAKNAIILVDFINQSKAEGHSTNESLLLANKARLRPILMTTIAMVIGMMPLALAASAGASFKNGLAWVIIGGLISSMFLTLIVVPVIYKIADSLIDRWNKNRKKLDVEGLMYAEA